MAQLAAKDRNIFRILVAFAVFFVLTAPAAAGTQTRAFIGFLGDGWDSFQTYLDGVFDDGTAIPGTTVPGTTGSSTVTVVVPATTPPTAPPTAPPTSTA